MTDSLGMSTALLRKIAEIMGGYVYSDCRDPDCVPDIPFFWGRHDCGVPQFFTHTFCPIHDDATTFFEEQFGLNKTQYTALMGE